VAPSDPDHEPSVQTTSERAALSGDVASQALNEALRVSFRVLKVAIALVAILFLCSGVYTVKQHERAFVLRFGRLVRDSQGEAVVGPGLHFAWPFLIDEVVRFPVLRDLDLPIDTFWYVPPPAGPGSKPLPGISPELGSYNLTGDANILHSRWTVTYSVADPVKFCEHLADPSQLAANKPSGVIRTLLSRQLENAVIRTMARYNVEDAYRGRRARVRDDVSRLLVGEVGRMDVGIEINNVILEDVSPPIQTKKAFDDVTNAKEDRGKAIETARGYFDQTVTEARGEATRIGSEAEAYRTQVVTEAEADASYMADLLKQYPDDREMLSHFLRQRLTEVLVETLGPADEVFLVRSAGEGQREVRIFLNRDPEALREVMKQRAEERKKQQKGKKSR